MFILSKPRRKSRVHAARQQAGARARVSARHRALEVESLRSALRDQVLAEMRRDAENRALASLARVERTLAHVQPQQRHIDGDSRGADTKKAGTNEACTNEACTNEACTNEAGSGAEKRPPRRGRAGLGAAHLSARRVHADAVSRRQRAEALSQQRRAEAVSREARAHAVARAARDPPAQAGLRPRGAGMRSGAIRAFNDTMERIRALEERQRGTASVCVDGCKPAKGDGGSRSETRQLYAAGPRLPRSASRDSSISDDYPFAATRADEFATAAGTAANTERDRPPAVVYDAMPGT
jgi:hypothetical protein